MKHAYAWTLTLSSVLFGAVGVTPGMQWWYVIPLAIAMSVAYMELTRG